MIAYLGMTAPMAAAPVAWLRHPYSGAQVRVNPRISGRERLVCAGLRRQRRGADRSGHGRRAGCVLHGGAGLLRAVFGERFVRIPLLAANADGAGGVKGDAAMAGNYKTGSFQRPFAAFLPHFCRRSHPCRTPATAEIAPIYTKFPFEKRYKKCRFIAIYRDKSAFLAWSWWTGSNPRPADYKSAALPTELHQHICLFS